MPPHPAVLIAVVFVVFGLYYAFLLTPVLAATAQPNRNINRIHIQIIDLDGGAVGQALQGWANQVIANSGSSAPTLEIYDFASASGQTIDSVKSTVLNGGAWASIVATPGASMALFGAMAQGCANVNNYVAANAINLIW